MYEAVRQSYTKTTGQKPIIMFITVRASICRGWLPRNQRNQLLRLLSSFAQTTHHGSPSLDTESAGRLTGLNITRRLQSLSANLSPSACLRRRTIPLERDARVSVVVESVFKDCGRRQSEWWAAPGKTLIRPCCLLPAAPSLPASTEWRCKVIHFTESTRLRSKPLNATYGALLYLRRRETINSRERGLRSTETEGSRRCCGKQNRRRKRLCPVP